jgi:hypothetical protein
MACGDLSSVTIARVTIIITKKYAIGPSRYRKRKRCHLKALSISTGFTLWSSECQATEVFELLESLFYNFDAMVASYCVASSRFEPIGDCYMAVASQGFEPQNAVWIVKFVHDSMISKHRKC